MRAPFGRRNVGSSRLSIVRLAPALTARVGASLLLNVINCVIEAFCDHGGRRARRQRFAQAFSRIVRNRDSDSCDACLFGEIRPAAGEAPE